MEALGGSRRKTFEAVREEIDYLLDPVLEEFDQYETVASIREDSAAMRRLSALLGISVKELKYKASLVHGKTHLWRLVADLRGGTIEESGAIAAPTPAVDSTPEVAEQVQVQPSVVKAPLPDTLEPSFANNDPPTEITAVSSDTVPQTPVAAPSSSAPEMFEGYKLIERLRGGGMSEAWRAETASGEQVFMKRTYTHGFDARALEREQNIYQKLIMQNFSHMLSVRDYRRTSTHAFLVTDFAAGGTLKSYLDDEGGELRAAVAKPIAEALARALDALHRVGVVHRDLKPQNILRSGRDWCLADFGIAKNLDRLITHHTLASVGTRGYMSPEQRKGADAHPSADIFSFGKMLAYMLTGHSDVDSITQETWWSLAVRCTAPEPGARPQSSELTTLVAQLLT